MKRRTKRFSAVLCLVLVFSLILTSVAMAYPKEDNEPVPPKHNPIELTNVYNARDVGGYETADGYVIKPGLLFRSGNLHDAEIADIENYGITKIIDLRTKIEATTKKNISTEGVAEQVSISPLQIPNLLVLNGEDWYSILSAIKSGIMEVWFANLYRQYIQDPRAIQATKEFFAEVEENAKVGQPILWHCTAGKDRTGIMCMLLMGALGCEKETLKDEFLNTRAFYIEKARAQYDKAYKYTRMKWIANEFYRYETVNEGYFDISWNLIERYGGMDNYLRTKIGLKNEDFEILKTAYLEGYSKEQDTTEPVEDTVEPEDSTLESPLDDVA